jgi:hypothetical protein
MQSQSVGHIGRVHFGEMLAREMQYIEHHQEGMGPLVEQEWGCRCRQASVELVGDETPRGDGLGAFFAFASAAILVLLVGRCCGRRGRRLLRLLVGLGYRGRGSQGH